MDVSMDPKFELVVAMEENWGIGKDGHLPWHIPSEFAYYTRLTHTVKDPKKKHVSIFGRKTWESIPETCRPWKNSICFVISNTLQQSEVDKYKETYVCRGLEEVISKINQPEFAERIERVWVHGGYEIYRMALKSKNFYRLYLTRVYKNYPSDAFFPKFDANKLQIVQDSEVPQGLQIDGDDQYEVFVYETAGVDPVVKLD